jgi:hypothetical protein
MKRLILLVALGLVFKLLLGCGVAYSQATFKIPFKFEAEGKSGKITLRREAGGEEVLIPFIEKLAQPTPLIEEPQLIFDMVGNFEPSYTEYVTDYLLAEVWLTVKDGFLVLTTERSEDRKSVKGMKAKK